MGKNKKQVVPPAPGTEPEKVTSVETTPVKVIGMDELMNNVQSTIKTNEVQGLDPNRRVDLLRVMHETFRMDPNAAEKNHMSKEQVDKINEITAIGMVAAYQCEVVFAKNPFAVLMSKTQLKNVLEIGSQLGLSIDVKALPAPDKDGNVQVPSTAVKVTTEAKKALKEEKAIAAKVVELDPTKVTNEEELRNCLVKITSETTSGFGKITEAIAFMKSYLLHVAADDAAKNEVNSLSNTDILNKIKTVVGPCPFVLNSIGHHMFTQTSMTKSPINAFCVFRAASKNKTTGAYPLTDQEIADYVRAIIIWSAESCVAKEEELLAKHEENLKALMKDKKANAKGIEDVTEKITAKKNRIEHFKEVISYVNDPSTDVVETLLDKYAEKDAVATRVFKAICDSYYDDIDLTTVGIAELKNNVKEYAGIIHNLFLESDAKIDHYSIANLIQLVPVTTEQPAEKTEETKEEPKKD